MHSINAIYDINSFEMDEKYNSFKQFWRGECYKELKNFIAEQQPGGSVEFAFYIVSCFGSGVFQSFNLVFRQVQRIELLASQL